MTSIRSFLLWFRDSNPHLLGWGALTLALYLAVGTAMCMGPREAHASVKDVYVDVAGGATHFLITAPDGDYLQKDLPHSLDLNSAAYRVLLGYHFNDRWSVQGGYLNLGTVNQTAKFVADEDYWAKASKCINNCGSAPDYRMTDQYFGGELTATRTFPFNNWSLFAKAGGAALKHKFSINRHDSNTFHANAGWFPATVAGVGACFKMFCAETVYYHGVGGYCAKECQWAMSQEMLVSLVSVKIPLGE